MKGIMTETKNPPPYAKNSKIQQTKGNNSMKTTLFLTITSCFLPLESCSIQKI